MRQDVAGLRPGLVRLEREAEAGNAGTDDDEIDPARDEASEDLVGSQLSVEETRELAPYQNATGQVRARRADTKAAIVAEREYLNVQLHHEDVAEFDYQPGKCTRGYRVIALRKNISRARGEHALLDEIRYFFYITTRTDLTAEQVVELANDRCDQENVIEQLKNGVNALRVPLYDLISNWAHMVIAALAWNIKSWFAMMMHRKSDRRDYIRMEFRRFLNAVILIPAMIQRRARAVTIRLIGYTPAIDRLFSVWATTERTRFG